MTTLGYHTLIKLIRDVDIAPALKQIITILLLLIMAGQATGIFYSKPLQLHLEQDLDDKNEHASKEDKKESKEFISPSMPLQLKLIDKVVFNSASVIIISSPVIDHLTPPPDPAS